MKRFLVVVTLGCLALSACATGGSGIELIVASSPEKTVAADTAKVQMTMQVVADTTESIVVDGAIDFTHDLVTMGFSVEGERIDSVIAHDTVFERIPGLPLPAGKTWVKVSFDELKDLGGGDLSALNATGQDDPSSTLFQLRGADDVRELGNETVRGTVTTHYQSVVDLEDAADKSNDAEAKQMRAMAKELNIPRIRSTSGSTTPAASGG